MKRRSRGRRRSAGQSLVEFSLVFPIFILILAAIIDFGLGMYSYMTVLNAAREGGRLAVTNCTKADCTSAVQSRIDASSNGLLTSSNCTNATCTVTCYHGATALGNCSGSAIGDDVVVNIRYTYTMIWPLTFGTQIPMTSKVTFLLE